MGSSESDAGRRAGSEWLVNVQDEVVVPMTTAEVIEAVRSGRLSTGSLVWRLGMHDWSVLEEVPQLRLAAAAQPPEESSRKPHSLMPTSSEIEVPDAGPHDVPGSSPTHAAPRPSRQSGRLAGFAALGLLAAVMFGSWLVINRTAGGGEPLTRVPPPALPRGVASRATEIAPRAVPRLETQASPSSVDRPAPPLTVGSPKPARAARKPKPPARQSAPEPAGAPAVALPSPASSAEKTSEKAPSPSSLLAPSPSATPEAHGAPAVASPSSSGAAPSAAPPERVERALNEATSAQP